MKTKKFTDEFYGEVTVTVYDNEIEVVTEHWDNDCPLDDEYIEEVLDILWDEVDLDFASAVVDWIYSTKEYLVSGV
jgi:hypothetical protein